jgi:hypothetical protein
MVWPVRAEVATWAEVREVAQGWVAKIERIQRGGKAGPTSQIGDIQELKHGPRLVAYYCAIEPSGYVVVSLHKELPPIRAYSLTGRLDPDSTSGLMGLIKRGAADRLQRMAERIGPLDQAAPGQLKAVMSRDYAADWTMLRTTAAPGGQTAPARGLKDAEEYQGGRVLLSSAWKQGSPYKQDCPHRDGCIERSPVGCVFLAAAQLMRYWCWPPKGVGEPYIEEAYDWAHMPDILTDESSEPEKRAVARLCHHAGIASGADYGCGETTGVLWLPGGASMDDGYQDTFRYSVGGYSSPPGYGPMKDELNANQPIHYAISTELTGGHSFVVDGWKEYRSPESRWLHVNYGYGPQVDLTWVNADEDMPDSDTLLPDFRLDNVVPEGVIGPLLFGAYSGGNYPMIPTYRYVSLNAAGIATFAAGQNLQFLPTTKLRSAAEIKIEGSPIHPTRLFTSGDQSKGILIRNGSLKLSTGGGVTLRPLVPPRYLSADGLQGQGAIRLQWERGPGDDTEVLIERSRGSPNNWVQIASVDSKHRLYDDPDAEPGVQYYYRLRCAVGARRSEYSGLTQATYRK